MNEHIAELEELLYQKLTEKENGILYFDEIIEIFSSKDVFGLRRVNSGAIRLIQTRENVTQVQDSTAATGRRCLMLQKRRG